MKLLPDVLFYSFMYLIYISLYIYYYYYYTVNHAMKFCVMKNILQSFVSLIHPQYTPTPLSPLFLSLTLPVPYAHILLAHAHIQTFTDTNQTHAQIIFTFWFICLVCLMFISSLVHPLWMFRVYHEVLQGARNQKSVIHYSASPVQLYLIAASAVMCIILSVSWCIQHIHC